MLDIKFIAIKLEQYCLSFNRIWIFFMRNLPPRSILELNRGDNIYASSGGCKSKYSQSCITYENHAYVNKKEH